MKVEVVNLAPLVATAAYVALLVVLAFAWHRFRRWRNVAVAIADDDAPQPQPANVLRERRSQADGIRALVLHGLLLSQQDWVHRRVESFELLDDAVVSRQVSVDFTVPRHLADVSVSLDAPEVSGVVDFVPLTMLRKQALRNFDLRDQAGDPVPLLTRPENARLTGDALVLIAERILGSAQVDGDLRAAFRGLAQDKTPEAQATFDAWTRASEDPASPEHERWAALLGDDGFRDLAASLVSRYALVAHLPWQPGQRRVLKFAYEQSYDRQALSRRQRWTRSLGWTPEVFVVGAPAANASSGYHLEIAAPDDLRLGQAELFALPSAPAQGEDPPEQVLTRDGPDPQRIHLNTLDARPGLDVSARIRIAADPQGFLPAGLATATLVFVLLLVGRFRLSAVQQEVEAMVAMLALIPGILVAYLVRPGEHALATALLAGVRVALVVSAAAAIAAATALIVEADATVLPIVWTTALGFAGLATAVLAISSVRSPRLGEEA